MHWVEPKLVVEITYLTWTAEREVALLDPCEWFVGDRIFHPIKYGRGTVVGVRGHKLIVDFERAGRKIVWASGIISLQNDDEGGGDAATREDAEAAEVEAILAEKPRFNDHVRLSRSRAWPKPAPTIEAAP